MLQDMDISWAPPRLGAPFPLFDTVQVRNQLYQKMAIIFLQTWRSCVRVAQSVQRPAGRKTCGLESVVTTYSYSVN